jgi:hypothetical protein
VQLVKGIITSSSSSSSSSSSERISKSKDSTHRKVTIILNTHIKIISLK